MRAQRNGGWLPTRIRGIAIVVFSGALALSPGWLWLVAGEGGAPPDKDGGKDRATIALGAELFQREWMPGDERSPGGDGLGPVYNDTSCVACHNLGAPGGGGPVNKNIVLLNVSGVLPTPVGTTTTTTTVEVVTPVAPPRIPPPSERPPALEPMFAFVEAENARLLKEFTGETKGRPSPPRPPVTPTPAPVEAITRLIDPPAPAATLASLTEKLAKVHPGFLTSQSVVLHRFGTNPGYAKWRQDMLGLGGSSGTTTVTTSSGLRGGSKAATVSLTKDQMAEMSRLQLESRLPGIRRTVRVGELTLLSSERNATPLFGAGLIDAIDAREIEAAAVEQDRSAGFSEIRGRVSRLPDGRVGRFGWKGQMASLDDFVLNACAVELGLEVPDHPQAIDPLAPEEPRTGGLDLTGRDCAALTAYVASLPAPIERAPAGKQEAARIAEGRDRFDSIGCAACHRPKLGQVAGIYSDLLLHDMGPGLGDSGSYGVSSPDSPGLARPRTPAPLADATRPGTGAGGRGTRTAAGPTRQEWRTPPLWGLRDSGPYLHDGRAATLEQAIAAHAGEAQKTAQRFFALAPSERSELLSFLKSLVAPTTQLARQ